MKKTIFIIPGYKHKPKNKAYKQIARMLKKQGFYPIPVTIPWKQTTISENTEHFLKKFRKINRKKKYVFGFSFGAMIAFLASTQVKASGLILCSLSPYFKQDLTNKTSIAKHHYNDFSQLDCNALIKKIKTKQIILIYGSKEAASLINRVNAVFDQLSSPHKKLLSVKKATHNLNDKKYLNTIDQITKVLN